MVERKTLFDVCIWYGYAKYLAQFSQTQIKSAIQNSQFWNCGTASVVFEAINGRYGKLVAHEHIWSTLEYKLKNTAKMPEPQIKFYINFFKSLIVHTGGNPDVAWSPDKKVVENLMWRHMLPDFEDSMVVQGALAAHANTLVTHDFELSMVEVPNLTIRWADNLTSSQRRAVNQRHRNRTPRVA